MEEWKEGGQGRGDGAEGAAEHDARHANSPVRLAAYQSVVDSLIAVENWDIIAKVETKQICVR